MAVYQDKHSFMDHYQRKTNVYYGILEVDVTPDTLLTVGIDQQTTTPRGSSWTGNPVYFSDGGRTDFPSRFNPGADWSRRDFQNRTYFASLEQALAGYQPLPQQTVNVRVAPGVKPLDSAAVQSARAEAEAALAGRGRLVLRPSGTEPVVRVTVEADDDALVKSTLETLADAVRAAAAAA